MATKSKYLKRSLKIPFAQNVLHELNEISNLIDQVMYLLEIQKFTSIYLFSYHKTSENALLISKIIKQKYPTLYEIISIKTIEKFYHYEPLEEGLVDLFIRKKVSSIIIKLTFYPTQEEIANPGCQTFLFDQRAQYQNLSLSELYQALYAIQQYPQYKENYSDQGYNQDDVQVDRIEYDGKNSIVEVFRIQIKEFVLKHKDIYGQEMNFQIPTQIPQQRDCQNHLLTFQIQQQNQGFFNNNREFVDKDHHKYSQNFNNYHRPDEDGFEEINLQGLNQNPGFNPQTKLPNDSQKPQKIEPINYQDNQLQQNRQTFEAKQSSGNLQNPNQYSQEDSVNSDSLESQTMNQKNHKNKNKKNNRDNQDGRDKVDNREDSDNNDDRLKQNCDDLLSDEQSKYQDNKDDWGHLRGDNNRDNQDKIQNQVDKSKQDWGCLSSDDNNQNQDNRYNQDNGNDWDRLRSNDSSNIQDNVDNWNNRDKRRDQRDIRDNRNDNSDMRDNRRDNRDDMYNRRGNRDPRNYRDNKDNRGNRRGNRNNREYKDQDYQYNNKKWNKGDNKEKWGNKDQKSINSSYSDNIENSQSSSYTNNSMDSRDNSDVEMSNENQRETDTYDYQKEYKNYKKKKNSRKIKFNPFIETMNQNQNEISEYKDKREADQRVSVNKSIQLRGNQRRIPRQFNY
ncbi:unnamed protein product [Paramecium octaurelia]|uniref:Uncharacterized protein n=1 Tax=Paramecium octaurelia TaxID=43137 RepID=A0A8S1VD66_PAROT|nr:unnamed protein product [Paramecium octaurelia]